MALSRDAEMMKGGYGDNYYMQIARNIRRFRGRTVENSDNVASNEKATVVIDNLSEWEKISRRYLDLGTSTVERNHTSVDRDVPYKDDSARNDIDYLKICNDGQNLYVAVNAKEDIEPYKNGDTGWMNLYLSAGEDTRTNLSGVFAVGDVRAKALRQVVTAVADGAVAAHYAEQYLLENPRV